MIIRTMDNAFTFYHKFNWNPYEIAKEPLHRSNYVALVAFPIHARAMQGPRREDPLIRFHWLPQTFEIGRPGITLTMRASRTRTRL